MTLIRRLTQLNKLNPRLRISRSFKPIFRPAIIHSVIHLHIYLPCIQTHLLILTIYTYPTSILKVKSSAFIIIYVCKPKQCGKLLFQSRFESIQAMSTNWHWLPTSPPLLGGELPYQYKSSLPYLPAVAKNRNADRHREQLVTGNSEYGSYYNQYSLTSRGTYSVNNNYDQHSLAPRRTYNVSSNYNRPSSARYNFYDPPLVSGNTDAHISDIYYALDQSQLIAPLPRRRRIRRSRNYRDDCEICNPQLKNNKRVIDDDNWFRVYQIQDQEMHEHNHQPNNDSSSTNLTGESLQRGSDLIRLPNIKQVDLQLELNNLSTMHLRANPVNNVPHTVR